MIGPDTKGPRLEQHGSSYYKPPFKNVTVAPIDIQGNVFEIKKRYVIFFS